MLMCIYIFVLLMVRGTARPITWPAFDKQHRQTSTRCTVRRSPKMVHELFASHRNSPDDANTKAHNAQFCWPAGDPTRSSVNLGFVFFNCVHAAHCTLHESTLCYTNRHVQHASPGHRPVTGLCPSPQWHLCSVSAKWQCKNGEKNDYFIINS